jgi:GTP cyclohydrolase I
MTVNGTHLRRINRGAVERAAADLLRALGADVDAEALEETPRRVADAFAELLTPHELRATTFPNDDDYDELIVARSIPFHSLYMHHPQAESSSPSGSATNVWSQA